MWFANKRRRMPKGEFQGGTLPYTLAEGEWIRLSSSIADGHASVLGSDAASGPNCSQAAAFSFSGSSSQVLCPSTPEKPSSVDSEGRTSVNRIATLMHARQPSCPKRMREECTSGAEHDRSPQAHHGLKCSTGFGHAAQLEDLARASAVGHGRDIVPTNFASALAAGRYQKRTFSPDLQYVEL